MLAGLRHHPLVGRNNEKGGIDAAHAGQHVLDEVDVAGHIDHADLFVARQRQPGEAQVDCHLALFFLAQPVGVDACQGVNQRRLAVIHVAGRADHSHLSSMTSIFGRSSTP